MNEVSNDRIYIALEEAYAFYFIFLIIFVNVSKGFISSGLELNPALREGSISHPFHFYVGSR